MDELRDETVAEVELLLRQRIGLNPKAVGRHHIRDALRQRLTAGEDVAGYLERVRSQEDEFQELVELLIVPESWFFRDVQPFRCVEHYLRNHPHTPQQWRILSAPCGTGEEPYSLVMTLLNAGVAPARICMDAVDISERALARTAEGLYDENSFREREQTIDGFRDRFFRSTQQRLAINEEVRALVRFRRANVMAAAFLQGEEPYHVIFCRNLLIYLDASARRSTLTNLHRLLGSDGLFYVGHVEAASVPANLFRRYDQAFPFAFQPARLGNVREEIATSVVAMPWASAPAARQPRAVRSLPTVTKPAATVADPAAELDTARQHADGGRLAEAEAQCLDLLTRYPPRADVYCLLGVVHQAQGEVGDAEKCFHKALYLDPCHHETLVYAALLAQQRGQEHLAQNYRRRADKARAAD